MFFLSQLLGSPVLDSNRERIGSVRDVVVTMDGERLPVVTGLVVRQGRRESLVSAGQIAEISEHGPHLTTTRDMLQPFTRSGEEVLLSRHVLDHQIIDLDGKRIIRVNDLQLSATTAGWKVTAVDVSPQPLARRLGLRRPARADQPRDLLDWADVEYFASEAPAGKLKVSHERVARLHPADIAHLVDAVPYRQGAEIVASLPIETAAEAMEEMTPGRQADLVAGMDAQRAAEIIEQMAPDDAADLIADLDDAKARDLLDRMEEEASEDVEELLAYAEDTAGGLMTPEFVSVTPDMSVSEAIDHTRRLPFEPEIIYYVYVVDSLDYDTPLLVGIASLRDMILGGLDRRMEEVMTTSFHAATPDTPAEEVARVVSEYNLLALPVVEEGQILGIVTVDDVMETLLPGPWRERIPHLFR